MTSDTIRLSQQLPAVTPLEDGLMLALWQQGLDTNAIANHLRTAEHQIYNRLLHVREAAR